MNGNPQQIANAFARALGHGSATQVMCRNEEMRILRHVSYGYRKRSTDEYVPHSYRRNFGWKNTYYQSAETVVVMPEDVFSACQSALYREVLK